MARDRTDADLPLHAEAAARGKWRDGETIIAKGGEAAGLPASEVDNAALRDGADGEASAPRVDLRPPD